MYDAPQGFNRPRQVYEGIPLSENSLLPGNQQQQSQRKYQRLRSGGTSGGGGGNNLMAAPSAGQHSIFGSTAGFGPNQIAPQRGSFQRLKELVWTERARELEEQRKSEAIAARAAVLKDITNGQQ